MPLDFARTCSGTLVIEEEPLAPCVHDFFARRNRADHRIFITYCKKCGRNPPDHVREYLIQQLIREENNAL